MWGWANWAVKVNLRCLLLKVIEEFGMEVGGTVAILMSCATMLPGEWRNG